MLAQSRILIVGLGLIGGSIALALRKTDPSIKLLAVDSAQDSLHAALASNVIDEAGTLEELVPSADIVIVALPSLTIATVIPEIAKYQRDDTVVTDVGSVKSHIIEVVNQQKPDFIANFVPGHPIAGSEQSGFQAAIDNLFDGRNVILTPQQLTSARAIGTINALWRALGADVLGMSVARHDAVLAATSHLPHLLAFAVVDTLVSHAQSEDIFRYAAGGFADFSRLASSDADMWSDIFVANASATEAMLDAYIDNLQALKSLLKSQDRSAMRQIFKRAKFSRDEFIARHFSHKKPSLMPENKISFISYPGTALSGSIRVPGDKSISHRSVIFGALADGVTEVSGFLQGEDALNTVAAFREMGVTIVGPEDGKMTIYGVGLHGLQAPRKPLYMGNSGTAMRLLAGLLAAQTFTSELTGDESLTRRPMARVADPLRSMGAQIATAEKGTPPLQISGTALKGVHYDMPVASAQVKSCLLLAGLYADGQTSVSEPAPSRDHTERMLQGFGYPVNREEATATVSVSGGQAMTATAIDVPADISSAAFFLVAASISPGSDLTLQHVGINPTRIGVINILKAMGADITLANERNIGGEPVADLRVRGSALQGISIAQDQIPLAIDEFPVLFVAAACANGITELRGAEELRVKESDRLEAMAVGLRSLGISVETFSDGIRIEGGTLTGGTVDSFTDHRIAMAFAVAGLRAQGAVTIKDCANVATSFPGFVALANQVGLQLTEQEG